ncbi:SPOR domain-containing protein [Brumicola nitratireducens]|uniref:Sporulation related protein n=1 Tax=Glaciecola nitratireducens (strain JCM 12485 / KCTC 12276 / FR1064) TaxID=1085623 RepID=G4QMR6_GLANF|nr:SPOR domain-containing protein [Glaciecola nitratireducens]AEP30999.1 sporulation related protein [Glaciecola nitratireducens FR1064]
MAQKDYVARSQKKKQPPRKKKQAPQAVAWVKVVLAILVVSVFVAGLWYLKDATGDDASKSSESAQAPVDSANAPAKSINDEKDPLPVLKEEDWEFIEGLPSYSVEVEVDELPNSDRRYLMQCGSFRKQSQAEELKATIAFQGLESQVLESEGSKGIWFRVVLGPYETKRDAERDRHALRSARINRCQIWNWD